MYILAIEDDQTVQDALVTALKLDGHTVRAADDLKRAEYYLKLAQEENLPFHAILSDFWLESPMGKTSGRETYALVRKYAGPDVPLLCASSDIPMWDQIKQQHEDERMYTRRKQSGSGSRNYWDEVWVKSTLAEVDGIPPLAKKRPHILLAGTTPSFLEDTPRALQEAGYDVTICGDVMAEADNLMPLGGRRPKYGAIISEFELAGGPAETLFVLASMKKPGTPFLATGKDLEQWAKIRKLAEESNRTVHPVSLDTTLFLEKLQELGI